MDFTLFSQIANSSEMEVKAIFGAAFVLAVLKMVLDYLSRQALIHRLAKLEQAIEKMVLSVNTLIIRGTK